jgi:hypothetical protein
MTSLVSKGISITTKKLNYISSAVIYASIIISFISPMFSTNFGKMAVARHGSLMSPSTFPYNFLLAADVGMPPGGGAIAITPKIRLDNLLVFTALWVIGTIVFADLERTAAVQRREAESRSSTLDKDLDTESFLAAETSAALSRANQLNFKSNLMLWAGIIMAFVGVVLFYLTLPQLQSGDDRWMYLERGLRPTGILISLEAIAWFFLRQYRALIEDFKWFHRLYLKKSNYLASLKLLSLKDVTQAQIFWATCVLAEDLTGRLSAGETTEHIEGIKAIEPNPVSTIFQAMLEVAKKK